MTDGRELPQDTPPRQPTLEEVLAASSEKFCRSALRERLDGESARFLLHAGTGLEHLVKAFLAGHHPALIVDAKNDRQGDASILHAVGLGRYSRLPLDQIRTISMRDAVRRAALILPRLGELEKQLSVLADVRNGVAHIGLPGRLAEEILTPFLQAVSLILEARDVVEQDFWDEVLYPVVQTHLDEQAEVAELQAQESIAAAKAVFEQRNVFGEPVLVAIESGYDRPSADGELVDCPACGRKAEVVGRTTVHWEADFERDKYTGEADFAGMYPEAEFHAEGLLCRICGLVLDSSAEIAAAGLPEERSLSLDEIRDRGLDEEPDWSEEWRDES
jgi:hypothetical protein